MEFFHLCDFLNVKKNFEHPFCDNFVTTLSFILHYFTFYLFIALVFIQIPIFFCKLWLSHKLSLL